MTRVDFIASVFAVGAVAIAIAAAPNASASADDQACSDMGGATQCERTGDVEIYATPQDMAVTPRNAYGPFEGFHAGHQ